MKVKEDKFNLLMENNEDGYAYHQLVASETRYRRLFESAKDGILILDAENGMIIDANLFLLDLVGLSKEEIIGKPIWEIGTFADIVANQDNFLELQQQEYIRYEDLPLQTVKGRQVTVEFVGNIYLEDQHKVIQFNIRDITERRQMEKALLESEQKLSSIIKNITDVIWSLSLPDMDLFYVSPSVEKMYGRSAEEFVKNPSLWQDAVHPDDQYRTEQTFKQIYEEGSAERECRIVRPDALTNERPYRKAWSKKDALEHIRKESGKHFDPQVVEMFFAEVK